MDENCYDVKTISIDGKSMPLGETARIYNVILGEPVPLGIG